MSIFDLPADHEARGIAKIVSEGRPQAVRTANRIARTKKSGSAGHTRPETRGVGPSATKTVENRRGEAGARNSQILTRPSRDCYRPFAEGGVNIGLVYFESET